jgi:hypothetical protein
MYRGTSRRHDSTKQRRNTAFTSWFAPPTYWDHHRIDDPYPDDSPNALILPLLIWDSTVCR